MAHMGVSHKKKQAFRGPKASERLPRQWPPQPSTRGVLHCKVASIDRSAGKIL